MDNGDKREVKTNVEKWKRAKNILLFYSIFLLK